MELVTKTKCDLYNQGLEKKIDDVGKKISNTIVLPKSVLPNKKFMVTHIMLLIELIKIETK